MVARSKARQKHKAPPHSPTQSPHTPLSKALPACFACCLLKWEDIDISRDRTGQITGGTLQHYRKVQLEHRLLVPDWQENGFVFTTFDGRPVRPNNVSCYFSWLRTRLGIKSTFHMLRHDMASRMKNSSHFDLKDIQAQLGHASIKITMDIYTHLDEESQQTKVGQWLEKDISELLNTSNELPLQNKS